MNAGAGERPDDLLPRTVARAALAIGLAAHDVWLDDESAAMSDLLDASMHALGLHFEV
ncbi:hypothetical protein [Pseudonocardia kunmingensis]|uniref:acyl-CoA-like ligand-binding transcription factor n=1 Tax=Pseudonocardia kunmingensis TaxID=630975 RepID=UPI00147901EC|nr:hypothetical protein [Pseudonocardia kunmingensis]